MPIFRVPCWINTKIEFSVDIAAETPEAAILNLTTLVRSNDQRDIDYIEDCINAGVSTGSDGPVDFDPETTNVKLID